MTVPRIIPVVDEGLGNTAYLVELGDGLPWPWTPAAISGRWTVPAKA